MHSSNDCCFTHFGTQCSIWSPGLGSRTGHLLSLTIRVFTGGLCCLFRDFAWHYDDGPWHRDRETTDPCAPAAIS